MKRFKKILGTIINFKYLHILIIFGFALLFFIPFFTKFHIGDDTIFHISNIEKYLIDFPFSLFGKIIPEAANNFGYGINFFYPPLPHALGGIIYVIINNFGLGIIATEKIFHFLIIFISGICMYVFAKKIFKDNKKALIASLFYITYDYLFVDIFMRDALNEAFLFMFMPLIFLGLYYLFHENNKKLFIIFFVGGYVGMIYSHLVMSVYFTIFILFFLLFYLKDIFKKKLIPIMLLGTLLIFVLTSTFIIPMIEHKLFGEYVVFQNGSMYPEEVWRMPIGGFFFKDIEYLTGYDGLIYCGFNLAVIILFFITVIRIIRGKLPTEQRKFIIAILCFSLLGIILNSADFFWEFTPNFLKNIQFFWRLAVFAGIGVIIAASASLDIYLNLFKKKYISIALLFIVVILGGYSINNINRITLYHEDVSYSKSYAPLGAQREYLPIKAARKFDYFQTRNSRILVTKGSADVKIKSNNTPSMAFEVTNINGVAELELPRLYYLGYKITDNKGNIIAYKENNQGFISVKVKEKGEYKVYYEGTIASKISFIIKSITIILIIGYGIYNLRKYYQVKKIE